MVYELITVIMNGAVKNSNSSLCHARQESIFVGEKLFVWTKKISFLVRKKNIYIFFLIFFFIPPLFVARGLKVYNYETLPAELGIHTKSIFSGSFPNMVQSQHG